MDSFVAQNPANKPDYFGAVYFSIAAIFALYELATGAQYISAFVAGPMIFTLLVLAIFLVPLFALDYLRALAEGMFKNALKGKEMLNKAFFILSLSVMPLCLAYFFYIKVAEAQRPGLFGAQGVALLAASAIQIILVSYPFGFKEKNLNARLSKWVRNIYGFGIAPAGVALLALLGGILLYSLAVGVNEIRSRLLSFLFYFIVFIFAAYRLKYNMWFGEKTGNAVPKPEMSQHEIALVLVFAALTQVVLYFVSDWITSTQLMLFLIATAYVALAYLSLKGGASQSSGFLDKYLPGA